MIYIYIIIIIRIIFFIISNLIIILSNILRIKKKINFEKISSFERGFNPKKIKRIPFNLRFFLIRIIFIIFDVEIALILPIIISINISNIINWLIISVFFLIFLLIGLTYEWKKGALIWV